MTITQQLYSIVAVITTIATLICMHFNNAAKNSFIDGRYSAIQDFVGGSLRDTFELRKRDKLDTTIYRIHRLCFYYPVKRRLSIKHQLFTITYCVLNPDSTIWKDTPIHKCDLMVDDYYPEDNTPKD